jgi:hypothetical protein
LPDPLGLNEVGNWLNLGQQPRTPGQQAPGPNPQAPAPGPYQPPYAAGQYQAPYQSPYPPPPGYPDPNLPPIPPIPPVSPEYWHPLFWRRKEPVGAIILIGLGLLFLLGQLDIFHGRLAEFAWPLMLIGVGVWLIVRRVGESQGGSK